MCSLKKDDVTYKLRAICMSYTSLIMSQSISRKYCYTVNGLWKVTSEWIGGEKAALWWPHLPSRTYVFHTLILSSVFQMDKKSFVCSGYLEREMENISAHGPKKYTCQKKNTTVQRALDFVSINLLFRWKHKCFGRQLLWPFLFLELSIKLKGFITLTAGAALAERRGSMRIKGGQPLSFVFSFCWSSFAEWPLCGLHLIWNLAKLEYFFSVLLQRQI